MAHYESAPPRRETYNVPEAGTILGIGRDAAYKAARSGELPTIRVGHRLLVPRFRLEEMLGMPVSRPAPVPDTELAWK